MTSNRVLRRHCRQWHALDTAFDTDPASPLHHDNRCELHRKEDTMSYGSTPTEAKITNLSALEPGDAVLVTVDGRTYACHVQRIAPPGTWGSAASAGPRVTVGFGPGRWNREVDYGTLRAGYVKLEKG